MSKVARRNPVGWLKALLGGTMPQNLLLGQDLPAALTTTSWTNRGSGSNATTGGSPAICLTGWPGGGVVGQSCAALRSGTYFLLDDASNYAVGTAFTWVFAGIIRNTAAQRNLMFLGSSSSGVNWRGFYVTTADLPSFMSNRNNTLENNDTGSGLLQDEPVIIGISLDGSGNLLIKQLAASGETTLYSGSHTMTGTLTVNRLSVGTAVLNNASSSPVDTYVRAAMTCRGVAADSATLSKILIHFRDNLGCKLDAGAVETVSGSATDLISLTNAGRIFDGKLQTSALATAVDDHSGNAGNGTAGNGAVLTKEYFDFINDAAASISSGTYVVPSGSGAFTLAATVKIVSGRSWSSGQIYNIFGSTSLGVTFLVDGGLLKYHYNGTLYSSGVNVVSTWVADKRYAVALVFDGTDLKCYINDMTTPVATHTSVGSRASASTLWCGNFNGNSNGWRHLIKNWSVFSAALTDDQLRTHFRGLAAHAYRISIDGDSNVALGTTDYISPIGSQGIWLQSNRYVFKRAKLRTILNVNNAFGGRMIDTNGGLTNSLNSFGATFDGLHDADYDNIAIMHCGTNDVHQGLYGGGTDASAILTVADTWHDARVTAAKYRKVGAFKIPPSTNSTFNTRIDNFNAGLASIFDFVIDRHADLSNPSDGIHWLGKANANDAEHYNSIACYKQSCQLRDAILNGVIPYYDA